MTEQKSKKSGIAKKLKKGILSPCIKSPKVKHSAPDKQDLDNIDHGTLSFDSSKFLKKRNSDLDTINTNFDSLSRRSNAKTESPLTSEIPDSETDSYLKRKPLTPHTPSSIHNEIVNEDSSDSEDDVPLSQLSKIKQTTPVLPSKSDDTTNNADNSSNLVRKEENGNAKIPMPVPTGSNDIKSSISFPQKMEPTKSEMGLHVDAHAAKQSIPMPLPTDSLKAEETDKTELSSLTGNETTYIIEEIVTEEIINGKKRITTQTITRRANANTSASPTSPSKVNNPQRSSLKMPVANGSKKEDVIIPTKMTPTRTETTSASESIVEMPMKFPQPSDSSVPNLVETEIDMNAPLSEIVNENEYRPSAVAMPTVPTMSEFKKEEVPQGKITDHVVSSPKLMAEENSTIPAHLVLNSNNSHPLPPIPTQQPVEPGFNFNTNTPPQQSLEGFNFNGGSVEQSKYKSIPADSAEAGFNFTITNENNMPISMPIPHQPSNENIAVSNSPPLPNLLATDSAMRKQAKQEGYLNIPQPLPPSAIEDNKVVEDDKSDNSYGSKKIIVSSPKVLTVDEQIQFSEQLANEQQIVLEENLKNEKPLGNFQMPKTPSTYYKNNALSDNEEINEGVVHIQTPVALPTPVKTEDIIRPSDIESQKMKLKVVNTNSDESLTDSETTQSESQLQSESHLKTTSESESVSESKSESESESESVSDTDSDDEKLFTIKQQYEQKKKELETRIGNLTGDAMEESVSVEDSSREELKLTKGEIIIDKDMLEGIQEVTEGSSEEQVETTEESKETSEDHHRDTVKETSEESSEDSVETTDASTSSSSNSSSSSSSSSEESSEESSENVIANVKTTTTNNIKPTTNTTTEVIKEDLKETKKDESEKVKGKMGEMKKKISSSLKKHQRSMSNGMSNMKKKMDKSLEQTKDHLKGTKSHLTKDKKSKEEIVTEVATEKITSPALTSPSNAATPPETAPAVHNNEYAHSETSFQDTLMGSLKRKNGARSIKSFFSFNKKDKKDKKDKKNTKLSKTTQDSIPEEDLPKESHSTFSFKRFVSPLSSKRRISTISTKTPKIAEKTEKAEPSESGSSVNSPNLHKPLPKPTGNMNKVIADLQAQNGKPPKFVIPEEALDRVNEKDDKSSVSGSSSSYSSSSASSSSSSSSDEEVLGNILNKKNMNVPSSPVVRQNNRNLDLNRNYTNVENDDFVSLMMVQHMLSNTVDRSESTIPIPEMPSSMINTRYSSVDLETERRKSYSKPKAIVTAVNPNAGNSVDSPRSTILYKFEDRPKKIEPSNFYKNDYASRSVGSLPIVSSSVMENGKTSDYSDYSSNQRMNELNLDTSIIETKDKNINTNNRKSVLDNNLKQMFDDIHNLTLDDITTRYTKPSMIQCDIGPSFLDEVMGSLSMNNH